MSHVRVLRSTNRLGKKSVGQEIHLGLVTATMVGDRELALGDALGHKRIETRLSTKACKLLHDVVTVMHVMEP